MINILFLKIFTGFFLYAMTDFNSLSVCDHAPQDVLLGEIRKMQKNEEVKSFLLSFTNYCIDYLNNNQSSFYLNQITSFSDFLELNKHSFTIDEYFASLDETHLEIYYKQIYLKKNSNIELYLTKVMNNHHKNCENKSETKRCLKENQEVLEGTIHKTRSGLLLFCETNLNEKLKKIINEEIVRYNNQKIFKLKTKEIEKKSKKIIDENGEFFTEIFSKIQKKKHLEDVLLICKKSQKLSNESKKTFNFEDSPLPQSVLLEKKCDEKIRKIESLLQEQEGLDEESLRKMIGRKIEKEFSFLKCFS
jgi:hypothetical protein